MVDAEVIEQIRQACDLAELVGESVALQRSGQSYKGLCPFHSERTPSFHVHPERGFFYCFGCQASGDCFAYLMQQEGCSFPEAAERLAERFGIEWRTAASDVEAQQQQRLRRQRDALFTLSEQAAVFFQRALQHHPQAALAQHYLQSRAVPPAQVEAFRLGFAPPGWDDLYKALGQAGASLRAGVELGLLGQGREGSLYDRFRSRLMFPITDVQGRVVGFSGRALGDAADDTRTPKYLNSPESSLFSKGKLLFGAFAARTEARKRGQFIVCEGNFDVLALHQAGFQHSAAPLGTALGAAQVRVLQRFASEAVLLFDGDPAGHNAAIAALPLFLEAGMSVRWVRLPRGDDPDTFLRRPDGPALLQQRIDTAPPMLDTLIRLRSTEAGRDPRAVAQAISSFAPLLQRLPNPVEIDLYVDKLMQAFQLRDPAAIRRQLRQASRQATRAQRRPAAPSRPEDASSPAPRPQTTPQLEIEVMAALLDQPQLAHSEGAAKLAELLTNESFRFILQTLRQDEGGRAQVAHRLREHFADSPLRDWLEQRLVAPQCDLAKAERALQLGVHYLERRRMQQRLQSLRQKIQRGEDVSTEGLLAEHAALCRGWTEQQRTTANRQGGVR
ncbi:MAG: DNA primase [Polyangiales bacterium]